MDTLRLGKDKETPDWNEIGIESYRSLLVSRHLPGSKEPVQCDSDSDIEHNVDPEIAKVRPSVGPFNASGTQILIGT